MSSFVGMMGGTPRHAIYFHGVDEQGGELRGKDPHYTQAGVKVGRRGEVEGEGYRESVKGGDVRVRIESIGEGRQSGERSEAKRSEANAKRREGYGEGRGG